MRSGSQWHAPPRAHQPGYCLAVRDRAGWSAGVTHSALLSTFQLLLEEGLIPGALTYNVWGATVETSKA